VQKKRSFTKGLVFQPFVKIHGNIHGVLMSHSGICQFTGSLSGKIGHFSFARGMTSVCAIGKSIQNLGNEKSPTQNLQNVEPE